MTKVPKMVKIVVLKGCNKPWDELTKEEKETLEREERWVEVKIDIDK